ncbi:hypothetical protein ABZY19_33825 [Streptomyces sp. NPDC006475]|uniref:hypothetical protein n=1 Tax=Streptomyces sp. NPDC006475 TaxID=3155719 RepID=UPI0033B5392F
MSVGPTRVRSHARHPRGGRTQFMSIERRRVKTHRHRTAFAVPVGILALLLSGCGDKEKKSTGSDRPATQPRSSAAKQKSTAEKPPTGAELSALLLQPGELDGYDIKASDSSKVTKMLGGDISSYVTSDKPECTPLARMFVALPGEEAVGVAGTRGVSGAPEEKDLGGGAPDLEETTEEGFEALAKMRQDTLSLSSYASEAGAQEERDAVTKAARSCAAGFEVTLTSAGNTFASNSRRTKEEKTIPVTSVTEVPTKWGDDASAWRLSSDGGKSSFLTVAAVQKGSVLVKTSSMVFDTTGSSKGRLAEDAIGAQLGKLP